MKIKEIHSIKDFVRFCDEIAPESIQQLTTEDWLKLYEKIDFISAEATKEPIIIQCQAQFEKLYKNYRLEKTYIEGINQLAEQAVTTICQECPEILDDIKSIALGKDNRVKTRLAERLLKGIYKSAYFKRFSQTMLRPKLDVLTYGTEQQEGCYDNQRHKIVISDKKIAGVSTIAHEIYHSIQGIRERSAYMRKLGIVDGYEDANLSKLNQYNTKYYMRIINSDCFKKNEKMLSRSEFLSYARQPIEYSAHLFGALLERKLNHKINYANEGLSIIKKMKTIFMDFGLNPDEVVFNHQTQKVAACFDAPDSANQQLIEAINKRYIQGQCGIKDQQVYCEIPYSYAKIRSLELQHRQISKTFTSDCNKDYAMFFHREFPQLCHDFPVLIERKIASKKAQAEKGSGRSNIINKPRILQNIKDFMFEK